MTTTADKRYGRRGGGWLPAAPTATPPGMCWTCRRLPAAWVATTSNDSWPVCSRCRDQGARYRAAITYQPLAKEGT